jgi:two-component system, OmpR family, phosphate regulon sensor histidine kinase PhoR
MGNTRLFWQLFLSFLIITALSLLAVAWYATAAAGEFYRYESAKDLEARARLLEGDVLEAVLAGNRDRVDALCKSHGKSSGTRITVVAPDGSVLGDSEENPAKMENHADRPEIKEAIHGAIRPTIRYSNTLRKDMMYVGVPLRKDGAVAGAIRTAVDLAYLGDELNGIYRRIAIAGLVIAGVAAIFSFILSRRIARPLEDLKVGAERFARGDLTARLPIASTEELGRVAESLNHMAQQLSDHIATITAQRNEVEAILASMVEGLLAVNSDEQIIRINEAAARMLAVRPENIEGRTIQEAVRNPGLHTVVALALAADTVVEQDVVVHAEEEKYLQAHGATLRDAAGNRLGAVIVLSDMTRMRRLENVRRDFVANVSHELRTPITSIKGFVETLQEGAINNPEDAQRFLGIIAKQADRLNAILEDLLLLASLEQNRDSTALQAEESPIREVLESALQATSLKAAEKRITVTLDCEPALRATVSAALLEQAVVNLVDNAIKYSEDNTQVDVAAARHGHELLISVRDRGCGIEERHLARIFERFYRVDKARSRTMGGTGLGLSIVKHIAAVHRGSITVESTPGAGSCFTIHIPLGEGTGQSQT